MEPYVLVLAQTSHEGARYVRRAGLTRGRWRIVAKASSIRGIRKAHVHCLPGFHRRPDRHSILAELRYANCEWFDVEMPPRPEEAAVDQGDGMGQQLTLEDIVDEARNRAATLTVEDVEELTRLAATAMPTVERPEGTPPPVVMPTVETPGAGLDDERIVADQRRRFPSTRQVEAAYRYNRLLDLDVVERQVSALERGMPTDQVATIKPAPKQKRRSRCADCGELHFKDESCVRTDGVEEAPVAPPSAAMFD